MEGGLAGSIKSGGHRSSFDQDRARMNLDRSSFEQDRKRQLEGVDDSETEGDSEAKKRNRKGWTNRFIFRTSPPSPPLLMRKKEGVGVVII